MVLSQTSSLGMFYGAYMIVALGRSACGSTILVVAVVNWFRTKAGIASAIALSGYMASGLLAPFIVNVVDTYGWRNAMPIFAAGLLIIVLPLSFLFRHKPEMYGYSLDGAQKAQTDSAQHLQQSTEIEWNVTPRQAIKGRPFWHLTLAFMCLFTILAGFTAHMLPYLASVGVKRTTASFMVTLIAISSVVGRIAFGFVVDKFEKRSITAIVFVIMLAGMIIMGFASAAIMATVALALVLFGISWGANSPLRAALIRELFGRKNFGAILGLLTGIGMIGTLIGAPLAGWVFDTWNSYQGALLSFAVMALVGAVFIWTTPKQNQPYQA
jgi:sugar phosphate permease